MISKQAVLGVGAVAAVLSQLACNSTDDAKGAGAGGGAGASAVAGAGGAAAAGGVAGTNTANVGGASGEGGHAGSANARGGQAGDAGVGGDAEAGSAGEAGARSGCPVGYAGDDCAACAADYQDHDANGSCLPGCTQADACSNAGSCDDSSGTRLCACEAHTHGADCSVCSPGFGKVDGHCVWQGVIKNGHFDTKTDWALSDGALIVGAGWSVLGQDTVCGGGAVSQTVTMPTYAEVGPLVLTYRTRRADSRRVAPPVGLFLNGVMRPIETDEWIDWADHSECLGDAAYGGSLTVAFSRMGPVADCNLDPLYIDDVSIDPAAPGQCPAPGSVRNGDFSAGASGWNPPDQGVSFGADGASLHDSTCSDATLSGQISVPSLSALPHAALAVTYQLGGTGDSSVDVLLRLALDGQGIAFLPQRAALGTVNVCLPAWARGESSSLDARFASVNGGTCADTWSAKLRSLALVSDPACSDGALLDGDFEAQFPLDVQMLSAPPDFVPWQWQPYFFTGKGAQFARAPALAHGGQGYLDVVVDEACRNYGVGQFSIVPRSSASGGPALRYWESLVSSSAAHVRVCADHACNTPAVGVGWKQRTLCIDPALSGQQLKIALLADSTDNCDTAPALEHVRFDDLELTTDASCAK